MRNDLPLSRMFGNAGDRSMASTLIILALTAILILPAQPAWSLPGPGKQFVAQGPAQPQKGLVDALLMGHNALPTDLAALNNINVIDPYDTFLHIQASQTTLDAVDGSGYDIRPLENLHTIWSDTVTFDTRDGEPSIPKSLRDDRTDLYIVQLRGPTKDEWLTDLSHHGTIVDLIQYYAMIMRLDPANALLVSSLGYVSWMGKYHPYYKIRAGFDQAAATDGSGLMVKAELVFYKDNPDAYGRGLGAVIGLGGKVLYRDDETHWWNAARITMPLSALFTLARLDGLAFMEPYHDPTARLDRVRWIVQSNDAINESTPIWDQGIHGEGIIVGSADTGIDLSHVAFRNSTSSVGTPGPDARKVVEYNTSVDDYDSSAASFHGTRTMGAIAGQNVSSPTGYSKFDGIAYNAKIAFYDVVKPDGTYEPPGMRDILQDAYNYGAESHSDSWGDDTTAYTLRAQNIDQFQWDHYNFLTFVAPGNNYVVWEPATAKDCVSVGNAYNGETLDIASSSAVGPANGKMINPHIVVPGTSIITPTGDMDRTNFNYAYDPFSGTSASTPVAAGATALIEQYFKDGFYPTGTKVPSNGFTPSGPLKKAALINSAQDQFGGMKDPDPIGHAPNNQEGWGKVKLDSTLYFQGGKRNLWTYDGYNSSAGPGLKTGEKSTYILHANSTQPLKVTLVWNDYPGGSGKLLNDLDLTVLDPIGNVYKGNVYQNGHSAPGGNADTSNPEETVEVDFPIEGFYIVNVTGVNIQSQVHQRFALVVTGSIHGADQGGVNFDRLVYGLNDKVGIRVVDSDVGGIGKVQVEVSSLKETTAEAVLLQETAIKGIFLGSIGISLGQAKSDGVLEVNVNDTILAQYLEVKPPGTRTATAHIDAKAPTITNVHVTDITNSSATIHWTTDKPADSNVTFGPSPAFDLSNRSFALVTDHVIALSGLISSALYYFDVYSTDQVRNKAVDNNGGKHYTFRTASYMISAKAGYNGWVREGENANHFEDGIMYSGYFIGLKRIAVMYFNLSDIPSNAHILAMTLKVYGRSRSATAPTGGTWSLQLLNSSVNPLFRGTTVTPTYNDISKASVDAMLGQKANADLKENKWMAFEAPANALPQAEQHLLSNGMALAIVGPSSAPDNMFYWDTGNPGAANSLGEQYAPQLFLTVNLRPLVLPNAPRTIIMDENTPYKMDMGAVFTAEGALEYQIMRSPLNLTANISNGALDLMPALYWSGQDYIIVRAIDKDGLYAETRINITVRHVNQQPHIVSVGGRPTKDGMVLNATESHNVTYHIVATDADIGRQGDLLIFATNLSWATVINGNLTVRPIKANVGRHHMNLTIRDLGGLSDHVDIIIDVANVNDPPVAVIAGPINGFHGTAGSPVVLNGSLSTDPDLAFGDLLRFSWVSSEQGKLGDGPVLSKELQLGQHTITLTVEDRAGLTSKARVNITICAALSYADDCDADGLPDYWEVAYGLDPFDPTDAAKDSDGDGYTNLQEYRANTNPKEPKSHPSPTVGSAGAWTVIGAYIAAFLVGALLAGGLLYLLMERKRAKMEERRIAMKARKSKGKKRRPKDEWAQVDDVRPKKRAKS
jgi:hypothetical protein